MFSFTGADHVPLRKCQWDVIVWTNGSRKKWNQDFSTNASLFTWDISMKYFRLMQPHTTCDLSWQDRRHTPLEADGSVQALCRLSYDNKIVTLEEGRMFLAELLAHC